MPSANSDKRVYFARSGRQVKIGIATNPRSRVQAMQTARPGIKLLGDISGGRRLEEQLHRRFSEFRITGEWFRLTEEIEQIIKELLNSAPALEAASEPNGLSSFF
jgi:hypothetical protein